MDKEISGLQEHWGIYSCEVFPKKKMKYVEMWMVLFYLWTTLIFFELSLFIDKWECGIHPKFNCCVVTSYLAQL